MIQLTDTINWDDNKPYKDQDNSCKNYIQNLIDNVARSVETEDIPMSKNKRKIKAYFDADSGAVVCEEIKYRNPKSNAGWAEIKSIKITVTNG